MPVVRVALERLLQRLLHQHRQAIETLALMWNST
jgi:hypothetical protein